ncbi:L,D-transpeptidase family protein [Variovorax sp. RA8]|uniref:L,D-transpeptidase family protein n=1 Tax=Variovorax sp. (strain JCM 16519 / RA8) TaxID=662548 RepID=UPI0013A55FF4|nr:L,D-transpeptidase family protein [Variovorax sp. RA8]
MPRRFHLFAMAVSREIEGRLLRLPAAVVSLMLLLLASTAGADSVWLDAAGRPNASARDALQVLADAPADGLVAQDYQARELALQAADLARAPGSAAASALDFDRALDTALQRFLHDLHSGRVDPRSLGFRVEAQRKTADVAALLHAAADEGRLPQAVAALRPGLGQYGRLREALQRYRTLAADPSLRLLPPIAPAKSLKAGDLYAGAGALHRLLVALGDLPAEAPPPVDRYDAALADGVRRFQERHGLEADGALGSATLAALNVPLSQRVLQLELALERLRWLPELDDQPLIGINIAMFRLWAWDPAAPADSLVDMNVVVGRALNTRTPVLSERMRYIIFRPYWNVPPSIVRNEILPAIARDPAYLQRHDMEIVRGAGDNVQPVEASTPQNLALLRQGVLRLRQRPGPANALGRVKFIFPNDENVYLHDTPATQLFGRARRDFSHGCVRVEKPVALARWVLREQPEWTPERIDAALAGPSSQRVDLTRPLPVILFYMTAMVTPSDRALRFAPDIYGHDARLVRALASRYDGRR